MSENYDLAHIVSKSRAAMRGGLNVLSSGEKLAAALVFNWADWLDEMMYTMAEAIERVGPEWTALIPQAVHILNDENDLDA